MGNNRYQTFSEAVGECTERQSWYSYRDNNQIILAIVIQ